MFLVDIYDINNINIYIQRFFGDKKKENFKIKCDKFIDEFNYKRKNNIKLKILAKDEKGQVIYDFPLIKYFPN